MAASKKQLLGIANCTCPKFRKFRIMTCIYWERGAGMGREKVELEKNKHYMKQVSGHKTQGNIIIFISYVVFSPSMH